MNVLLVCEGACNPTGAKLKARIAMEMRQSGHVCAATVRAHRRLRYTEHREVGLDTAICLRCGQVRRYGHTRGVSLSPAARPTRKAKGRGSRPESVSV